MAQNTKLTRFHFDESIRTDLKADLFCPRCTEFLSIDSEDFITNKTRWLHSDLKDICRTASDGCHLCSLLQRSICEEFIDMDQDAPIHLYISSYESGSGSINIVNPNVELRRAEVLMLDHADFLGESRAKPSREEVIDFRQAIRQDALNQTMLSHVDDWIRSCRRDHSFCASKRQARLPTRLIEISQDLVRLVDSQKWNTTSGFSYTTLSHRWPQNPGIQLKKDNTIEFEQGFALSELPALFQDACRLSVALACSYIWIDALCIIQDDGDDWTKEAALMASVYSNSYVNIVAGTMQQHDGLWQRRNPLKLATCCIAGSKLAQKLEVDTISILSWHDKRQVSGLQTHKRAWILQETELAPRVVYFGDTEILFECCAEWSSESRLAGGVHYHPTPEIFRPGDHPKRISHFINTTESIRLQQYHDIWADLILAYTSRDISFETDRLIAISGLSKALQEVSGDELGCYHAGIWETGFERHLLWRPNEEDELTLTRTYLAPSWSWASHMSGIAWFEHWQPHLANGPVISFLENLSISCNPVSKFAPYGRVDAGQFTCLANLCLIYNFSYEIEEYIHLQKPAPNVESKRATVTAILDRKVEDNDLFLLPLICYGGESDDLQRPHHRQLFVEGCFPNTDQPQSEGYLFPTSKRPWMHDDGRPSYHFMAGLILQPVNGRNGYYTRVGVAEFGEPESVMMLQEACRKAQLPAERYIDAVTIRYAYQIVVI